MLIEAPHSVEHRTSWGDERPWPISRASEGFGLVEDSALLHEWSRTRLRSRAKLARPNIRHLGILIQLTCRSTTPESQGEGESGDDGVEVAFEVGCESGAG
ncbi:hypothetical protein AQJ27_40325 [Streptomyces olivochromogenes]|nr:hypothetical protein AQJ27_40325 [Streptomyces olivochromogenes]